MDVVSSGKCVEFVIIKVNSPSKVKLYCKVKLSIAVHNVSAIQGVQLPRLP